MTYQIKPLNEHIAEDKIFSSRADADSWVNWYQSYDDCHPGHTVIQYEDKFYVVFRCSLWDDIYYNEYNWNEY